MDIWKQPTPCACGKCHNAPIEDCIVEKGALSRVGEFVRKLGAAKPFVLADANTFAAAGNRVCEILQEQGIPFRKHLLPPGPKPDERTVGSVVMHYDSSCDIIVAVGSGVINDIGKILANTTAHPYIIVATAPSMDGYASQTSSMDVDGLKVSLPTRCADVILGDIDMLKNAPERMLLSGLGDMLAKFVSICEWRIAHIITGEYYCPVIAQMIRSAVKKCVDNAPGLLNREENAVQAVFEGLILGGLAMNYAGISRPASGVEHYFSHIWDMRGLEFGTPTDFHGIQCAVGTLYATKVYEQVRNITPNWEKALAHSQNFDLSEYFARLKAFLGKGADAMIALEEKEQKYDPARHAVRLEKILAHWDEILQVMEEELMPSHQLASLLDSLGMPKRAEELGIPEERLPMTFLATKDIRDKYVLSRLCWDLGILDEIQL